MGRKIDGWASSIKSRRSRIHGRIYSIVRENKRLPLEGNFDIKNQEKGGYVLSASYKDFGANGIDPLTGRDLIILRSPKVEAFVEAFTQRPGVEYWRTPPSPSEVSAGTHLIQAFDQSGAIDEFRKRFPGALFLAAVEDGPTARRRPATPACPPTGPTSPRSAIGPTSSRFPRTTSPRSSRRSGRPTRRACSSRRS